MTDLNLMNFSNFITNDIKMLLPEFFLVSSILMLIIHGAFLTVSSVYNFPLLNKSVSFLAVLVLIFTLFLLYNNPILFIIFFALLGLLLLISSNDLISAYLAIEMQSLSFYMLALFKRNSVFSIEAGLFYLLNNIPFNSNDDIIYGFNLYYYYPAILIFSLFLAVGLLFKLAAALFHMWSPDVYEGSLINQKAVKSRSKKPLKARVFEMNYKIKYLENEGLSKVKIRKVLNLYCSRNKELMQYLIFKIK